LQPKRKKGVFLLRGREEKGPMKSLSTAREEVAAGNFQIKKKSGRGGGPWIRCNQAVYYLNEKTLRYGGGKKKRASLTTKERFCLANE